MGIKLGDSVTLDFTCHNPTTGQVQDADVLPTSWVFENADDTAILTPVVVKRVGQTGVYRLTFALTAANGFEIGKSYNVDVQATVAGITAKSRIESFILSPDTQPAITL
jgi:hypothetical protein